VRYRLLGPLHVARGDAPELPVDLGPPKQRAVLAVLLLAQGGVVSVDRLVDAVWGDDVPGSALASLQAYISNLRRALRDSGMASPIVRQPPGYYLDVDPDDVDAAVFAACCARAADAVEAGAWDDALTEAEAGLALWRGPLLADFADEPWVVPETVRVEELRRECRDARITALLALGRASAALSEAATLATSDPLSERGCWLHMLALYRSGRVPEALEVYVRHTRVLADELGLDPGAELRDLQTAILNQAPELAAWPRTPEWTGAVEVTTPATEHPVPADVAPRSTLVGRERELSTVADLLVDVGNGLSCWLVLSGPPGIGKTRLAEEIVARGEDGTVWVSCPDERATPPWWPMRQLVRALGADADEVLEVPAHADPDTARFQVYERIHRLLEAADGVRTVVIDDVQWADTASTSALAYMAGALRDHPIAIVLTVRDGEHTPELGRLLGTVARGARNRHVTVPALSSGDVAALASAVAEDAITAAEAATLAERTGGNPFFVCEYARLPRDERAGNEIPVAVKSVLDRRLASLDPAVLQVLRTAAVIGDEVDVAVLRQATRLDIDTLADYLDEAADERIVVTSHTGDGYAFAHGLLREQLLAGMPALRRQRLHAKVAEVLADGTGDDALTRRAQHLIAAQPLVEPDLVVDACRRAAEEATQRWSSDIAAKWWQAALDAYDRLPVAARDDDERDALAVAMLAAYSRAGRGRLVLGSVERYLAEAMRAGRVTTVGRLASALLRASGGWPWLAPGDDPGGLLVQLERAAAIADAHSGAGARVLAALAVGHCYHPDPAVAAGYLDRAEALAEDSGDADVVADALMGKLITYSGVATLSGAILDWERRLNTLQHSRFHEDRVIAHSVCTMAAMNLGDVDGAERHLRAGIAGSEELQLPVLRAQLRWMEAVLAVWRGDFAEAQRHHGIATYVHEQTELYGAGSGLMAEVSLLRETGGEFDPAWLELVAAPETGGQSMLDLVTASLLTVAGGADVVSAADALLSGWLVRRDGPHVWTTLGYLVLLAHLAADCGLARYAEPLLTELEPFGGRIAVIGHIGVVGPVALATARLRALTGDTAGAHTDLDAARTLAERTGGVPSLVRCALLSAQLTGDPAVTTVADEARTLGMLGVVKAADNLR
jgi:DNA-binding SARP family transcriptional activator